MKQKIINTFLGTMIALVAMVVFIPSFSAVNAQGANTPDSCTTDCARNGLNAVGQAFPQSSANVTDLPSLIKKIIDWALYFAAIVAVIMIIYGGFIYMTSAGDSSKAGKGRSTLVNALIGLVMIVLSYLVVQVVYNFLVN